MNKCVFIGNIGHDLELKLTNSNIPFVQFNLALQRPFKNQEGNYDTDWVTVIAYRKLAENLCQYQGKGSKIAVESHVQVRSYEKENKTYYVTEFIADNIEFLESKKKEVNETQSDEFYENSKQLADNNPDLPF